MSNPSDRKYAESHEWIKIDGDTAIVGITDHAQDALGDITFIELPEVDAEYGKGDDCAVVESVKAASDIYAPVSGTITEVNEKLEDEPELVNSSAFEDGWIFKLSNIDTAQLDSLMDAEQYEKFLAESE